MGKSCSYYSDTLWEYYFTMDNLVVAKLMHDYGKPLPGSCIFSFDNCQSHVDSLFYPAIEQLFDFKIDPDEEESCEERNLYIPVPEMEKLSSDEQLELIKPLLSMHCDKHELEFETKYSGSILHVRAQGSYGYTYEFLKKIIQFIKNLEEKKKGVEAYGSLS